MNLLNNIEETPLDSLDLQWDRLSLSKNLLEAIKKEFKFSQMTPVQAATIPLMLMNKDVIVEAKTGSGKTLAFLIPVIESLIRLDVKSPIHSHDLLAIILSPTRELAVQIHQELRKLLKNNMLANDRRLVHHIIVGGSSVSADIDKYNKYGANIIVATPGRLSAILQMSDTPMSSSIRKKLAYLIFDEADQLLSFGFEKDLSSILAYLPKQRRTSLFSATQTSEVEDLIKSGLRNPIRVNVNKLDENHESSKSKRRKVDLDDDDALRKLPMPEKLTNYFYVCDSYAHKLAVLTELINRDEYKKVLVFLSTCSQIDYFSWCIEEELKGKETKVLKLHRRLKNKRKAVLKEFKARKSCILIVTDILSRGIDVPDIACVIHLDLPTSPECYVHRSGRSGHQIELSGVSVLLLEHHEIDYVEMCRRRQIELREMTLEDNTIARTNLKAEGLIKRLRRRALKDESFQTLGIQSFVSYIRFYSSKLCLRQLLFPKLSIAILAIDFGLVRLPQMPELRKRYKAIEADFNEKAKGMES